VSRTIGVIGGMGPAATLDFLGKLIAATPAEGDQDHLRVLVDNNPKIPDRNAGMAGTGPSPAPVLAEMARGLERQGAEALVMACNTAHAFADDIRAAVAIPFFSIVEESADELTRRAPEGAAVGVLATTGCLDAGLYQRALADRGLGALVPGDGERQRLMAAIYRIKTGDVGEAVRGEIAAVARALVDRGAAAVLSACTELPLVLKAEDLDVPLLDSTDVLVAKTVAWATAEVPPEEEPLTDEEITYFAAIRATREFAEACARFRAQNGYPDKTPLDELMTSLATELWDRNFSQAEVRAAFERATSALHSYAARVDRRP